MLCAAPGRDRHRIFALSVANPIARAYGFARPAFGLPAAIGPGGQ
jgi:hypothetical protein